MTVLTNLGDRAIEGWNVLRSLFALIFAFIRLAFTPSTWRATTRLLFARQVLFTGVEALGLTLLIAVLAGISVVAQARLWLATLGQTEMLGSVLVTVLVREVGPLLVNFVVIGRSGTAIATELSNMKVRGEVDVLDAQGLDPTAYLVVPRVAGIVVSVVCLAVIMIATSFLSGFYFAALLGASGEPGVFLKSVLTAVTRADIFNLLAKTVIPGLITGTICCIEGLNVGEAVTDVPRAATRSVVRSIIGVIIVSAVVSVLTYV